MHQNKSLISIGLPFFNAEKYLSWSYNLSYIKPIHIGYWALDKTSKLIEGRSLDLKIDELNYL